ncbi:hypothetical protein FGM00_13510 [Aggregatimonas sangjinii]|uniref:Uncharacterized protein n=1 Tax=Aggregatimonas sangjinii TaxID=2583587 RepID=A0A5B7SS83_9FLAO|nr:hypothetical protein [Aggregatimonas sangjinii]QCX01082.1 hypothetical protein FGM00_13510 [Aggregatimonas sangjinii]
MRIFALHLFLFLFSYSGIAQVLNTSNPEVQSALGSAQVEGSPLANFFSKRTPMMDILHALVKDDDGLVRTYVGAEIGSAYEDETFAPGKVFYGDDELGEVYYRLNAYNNEIEIKKSLGEDEEKQLALIKNAEVRIVAPDREIYYLPFTDENGTRIEGYLTLLKKGEHFTLYRRIRKKFTPPKAAENSMVNSTPSRFTDYTEYYLERKDASSIVEMPIHKKKLGKLFSQEQAPKIKAYFKKHNPDDSIENDVLQLFHFLDNLE